MALFARIDSQIRANRPILANRFRVPKLNPFFANRASGGLKIANRRFEAIRANRSRIMKIIGWDFAELIFRGFLFLKNLGANASTRFSPKMSRWTLTCSP